ncbi:MAG TPA: hypothetical protein VFQ58_05335 [Flavisolibacter sp.]|nr:hypothetical protein [Flavisolibacter sp.]
MKKQTQNLRNTARNFIVPAFLFTALLVGSGTNSVNAQSAINSTSPSVKYLGKSNDQLVFQVDYDNTNDEVLNLAIKDEDGNILYADRFRDKKLSKKFKVNSSEYGNMKLTFVLSTDKEKQSQVFQVNTNTRVIDDVVVTNLK